MGPAWREDTCCCARDHPLNQEIARALLREKGVLTWSLPATDRRRGSTRWADRHGICVFDAMLMHHMPVMDGMSRRRARYSRADEGT